ncbi:MAG: nucleotidyltransferase domain-containing protein [Candidatus Micrarchaeia archaeon]
MYKKTDKLRITENHLQILTLFTAGFDKEYYIREVQKLLGISPRTAQLILEDLERKAVLESHKKGKIKIYKIKKSQTAEGYLTLAEIYKKISFLESNLLIREIVEKITPHIEGILVIFGSYAKGVQKKSSDLDIFIAGSYNDNAIKKISNLYGIKVNVKNYPMKLFKKKIKESILLKEITDNHIIISGADVFVAEVLK